MLASVLSAALGKAALAAIVTTHPAAVTSTDTPAVLAAHHTVTATTTYQHYRHYRHHRIHMYRLAEGERHVSHHHYYPHHYYQPRHHYYPQRYAHHYQPQHTAPAVQAAQVSAGSGGFQSCVIRTESGGNAHAVNPTSGAGGLYQFLPSTWSSLGYAGAPQNASVATQNAAFAQLYAQQGKAPWSPSDGC